MQEKHHRARETFALYHHTRSQTCRKPPSGMIPPNLYSATYSNVKVYEYIHPRSSVMRRRSDDWVNATHILKVANFPKAKRTRILEKGVQTGVHEKVQGGYGKYQGTWVPLDRAIAIAKEFSVLEDLTPMFNYTSNGTETPPPAPKHHHVSTAINGRKKTARIPASKAAADATGNPMDNAQLSLQQLQPGVPAKRGRKPKLQQPQTPSKVMKPLIIHQSPGFAAPVLNLKRNNQLDTSFKNNNDMIRKLKVPTTPRQHGGVRILGTESSPMMGVSDDMDDEDEDDDEDDVHGNGRLQSQQSQQMSLRHTPTQPSQQSQQSMIMSTQSTYPHRADASPVEEFMNDRDIDNALAQSQTYGKGASSLIKDKTLLARSIDQHRIQLTSKDKQFATELVQYFELADRKGQIPSFLIDENSDFDVNRPLDEDGNTALHLACAMGDIRLCEILIRRNCNTKAKDIYGKLPIFSLVKYSNSYIRGEKNFEKFIGLLINNIFEMDLQSHTILHEIALSTLDDKSKPAARYYTENLLRIISELNQINMESLNQFINKQDINGNTALHIFTQTKSDKCIRILLEYQARVDIKNNKGEITRDYINKKIHNLGIPFEIQQSQSQNSFQPHHQILQPNGSFLQSKDLSFMNNYQQSLNNYGTLPMSFLQPPPSQNTLYQNNGAGNLLPPLSQSFRPQSVPVIYTSESANHVIKSSNEIMEKLTELAKAFESDVISKEHDKIELSNIVDKVNEDLNKNSLQIKHILMSLLDISEIDDEELAMDKVKQMVNDLEKKLFMTDRQMKSSIERRQLFKLKYQIDQSERSLLTKEEEFPPNDKETQKDDERNIKLGVKLTELQITRKHMVDSLTNMIAQGDETRERISKFRRLMSYMSTIPISQIDESLQSIEENLKLDSQQQQQQKS